MPTPMTLITGAGGEMGHALIDSLYAHGEAIIAADVRMISKDKAERCTIVLSGHEGDVTSPHFIRRAAQFPITRIFHLAAVLSTAAERDPLRAHTVNVDGSLAVLELAQEIGEQYKQCVQVIFPSTIAVYGFASLEEKVRVKKVREDQALAPHTLYGIAKLHCERLGEYYTFHYKKLANHSRWVDFRAVRFPGLISAETLPSGGTSDYAPEMLHAAAQGKPYRCFVRPSTQIPFMAMPDGIKALRLLADAPAEHLTQRVYNIGAFAPTAEEIATIIRTYFPGAEITYAPDERRQAIVDSWCADVDDSAARRDWGWQPEYDLHRAFAEYLIPQVIRRYQRTPTLQQ